MAASLRINLKGLMTGASALLIAIASSNAQAHPGAHHDVERLTGLLKERPEDVELLIQRAHFARLDRQFDLALRDLKVVEAIVSRPDVHFHRGRIFADEGLNPAAEREFTLAIDGGLKTGQAYAARGRIRREIGEVEDALVDFDASLALMPDLELYVERGELQVNLNRLDDAEKGYREAVSRLGDAFVIRSAQIDLAELRGTYRDAIALVDEQLSKSRSKTDWLLKRAEILARAGDEKGAAGDRQKALEEINVAIARRPVGIHLVTRAKIYLAMGRRADARQDVLLALSKSPTFGAALELLAQIESESGRPGSATQDTHTQPTGRASTIEAEAGPEVRGETASPSAQE